MARPVDDLLATIDDVLGPDDGAPVPSHWDVGYSAEDAMTWIAEPSRPSRVDGWTDTGWTLLGSIDRFAGDLGQIWSNRPAVQVTVQVTWGSADADPLGCIHRWMQAQAPSALRLSAEQRAMIESVAAYRPRFAVGLEQTFATFTTAIRSAQPAPPPMRRVDVARQRRVATGMRRVERRAARRH